MLGTVTGKARVYQQQRRQTESEQAIYTYLMPAPYIWPCVNHPPMYEMEVALKGGFTENVEAAASLE